MKTYRDHYLENYTAVQVPSNNKKGFKVEYVYHAPWYLWKISPQSLLTHKASFGVACLLNIVMFVVIANQYSVLNYAILVAVPSTLSLIALMYEVMGVIQFYASKERMKMIDYKSIHFKMTLAPLAHAAMMLLTVLACIYTMISISFDSLSIFTTLGYLFCAGMSAFIYFSYRTIPFTTERNRTLEEFSKKMAENKDSIID